MSHVAKGLVDLSTALELPHRGHGSTFGNRTPIEHMKKRKLTSTEGANGMAKVARVKLLCLAKGLATKQSFFCQLNQAGCIYPT